MSKTSIILEIIDSATQEKQRLELSEEDTKKLIDANLKISGYIEPSLVNLDSRYSYKITGGTSTAGFPLKSDITGLNRVKKAVFGRKKPLTMQTNQVKAKTRVLNVVKKKRNIALKIESENSLEA